jgi:uncharacterized protein (DUF2336 family)
MSTQASLIAELEEAVQRGSSEQRLATLRRVTNLFLVDSERLNDEQIQVFDEVLAHLIVGMEAKALAQLSERLAPIHNAPNEVVQKLARHDEIAVAGPVISTSARLTSQDLIEIAKTKSQDHLLAMCARKTLPESVTDTLIERGNDRVIGRLVENTGAAFSDAGYMQLVEKARADQTLFERIGLRIDIPLHIFRQLLERATEAVRTRLLLLAPRERQDEIRSVLQSISNETLTTVKESHNFEEAEKIVRRMQESGQLNQFSLLEFSRSGRYAETVASLALMCGAPLDLIERIFNDARNEALLIPCKAAGLSWMTLRALILTQFGARGTSEQELGKIKNDYIRLSQATAQRVLRFWCTERSLQNRPAPAKVGL